MSRSEPKANDSNFSFIVYGSLQYENYLNTIFQKNITLDDAIVVLMKVSFHNLNFLYSKVGYVLYLKFAKKYNSENNALQMALKSNCSDFKNSIFHLVHYICNYFIRKMAL